MALDVDAWTDQIAVAPTAVISKLLIDAGAMRMADYNAILAPKTKYVPHGGQKYLHEHTGWGKGVQIKLGAGGWRAGKSRWLGREASYPLVIIPNARGWIIGADYDLAHEEFDYALADFYAIGYPTVIESELSRPKQGRWYVKLSNGSTLETQTAEDLKKIEAANLNVVALVEAGSLTEDLRKTAEGRVLEARARGLGGILAASGRHRGSFNWYTELWRKGQASNDELCVSASLPSWENEAVFKPCDPATCQLTEQWPPPPKQARVQHGGFHNPHIQYELKNRTEDDFGEMVAAEPRPDRALVLADWFDRKTHMVQMEFEDRPDAVGVADAGRKLIGWRLPIKAPVEIWMDPGYRGAYAVLARQKHGKDIMIIDELYVRGWNTAQVIEEVKRRWWYPYCDSAVVDVRMKWDVEGWWGKECNIWPRGQAIQIADGIERIRSFLRDPATKRPHLFLNSKYCAQTADEAEQGWRYHVSRNTQDPRGDKEEPVDANNHSWAAIAYGLIDNFGKDSSFEMGVVNQRYS